MKISALQKNLKKGLSVVGNITSKNVNLPILNNVKVEARDDKTINLVTTNLEIGITHGLRGRVDEPGEATMDSKVLLNYVSLLPNKQVNIEQKEGKAHIRCENYKTTFNSLAADDFPLIPAINKEKYFTVNTGEIRRALSQVVFAASTSESRADLSGILFFIEGERLYLVATDSYRLAEKNIKILKHNFPDNNFPDKVLVPSRTVQELVRVLSGIGSEGDEMEDNKEMKISIAENQISFTSGLTELISRLIEGQFPDYKQVIPNNIKTEVLVEKDELIRATKASALFSQNAINDIHLHFSAGGKLIVRGSSGQLGDSQTELETKIEGGENALALNYRYLLDGLNSIEGDYVKIEVVDKNSPCILRTEKTKEYLYLIMPIKQ